MFDHSSREAFARSVHEAFDNGSDCFSIYYENQQALNTVIYIQFLDKSDDDNPFNDLIGAGFSKVSSPDTFSPSLSRRIAIEKALYDLCNGMFEIAGLWP
jgi:hypothetical protein